MYVNAEPVFTIKSLNTLKIASRNSLNTLYCALVRVEISIGKHIELDGIYCLGFVNFGSKLNSDINEAECSNGYLMFCNHGCW